MRPYLHDHRPPTHQPTSNDNFLLTGCTSSTTDVQLLVMGRYHIHRRNQCTTSVCCLPVPPQQLKLTHPTRTAFVLVLLLVSRCTVARWLTVDGDYMYVMCATRLESERSDCEYRVLWVTCSEWRPSSNMVCRRVTWPSQSLVGATHSVSRH